MSEAAEAILAFGYDLGGHDVGWNFQYKPASRFRDVIEGNKSHGEAIENYILEKFEFTEDPTAQGYWARRTAKLQEIGVQVVRYGTWLYPGYILACEVFESSDFGSKTISVGSLSWMYDDKITKIKRVYEKLNIIPKYNQNPAWILAAFYG